MTAVTNLDAARLLIGTLTDTDKLALLQDQLWGDLGLDCEQASMLMDRVADTLGDNLEGIEEAIEADGADDYDGGRFDFVTSRGLRSAA